MNFFLKNKFRLIVEQMLLYQWWLMGHSSLAIAHGRYDKTRHEMTIQKMADDLVEEV